MAPRGAAVSCQMTVYTKILTRPLLSAATYDTIALNKSGWPTRTQLAWPILGVRHFSDINRTLLVEAGASLNLAKGTAERLLESLRSRVAQIAEALYAEVQAANELIVRAQPHLSATLSDDSRCLRTILHIVIKEMARQIARTKAVSSYARMRRARLANPNANTKPRRVLSWFARNRDAKLLPESASPG